MKKLIAVLMTLCLMIGAAAAFAENTPRSVSWDDHKSKATNGQFLNVTGTNMKMYVPDEFKPSKLSDETTQRGISMVLKSEKNDTVVIHAQTLAVDLAAFKANMEGKGFKMSDELTVNGRAFTQFSVNALGATSVCFATANEDGKVQIITFSAADMNAYSDQFRLMAASIQNADAAEN